MRIHVTGFLGIWLDSYSDKQDELAEITMNVFYHGVPVDDGQSARASEEASEIGWFKSDEVPDDIAFPASQLAAVAAWRKSLSQGQTVTPLIDRPEAGSNL